MLKTLGNLNVGGIVCNLIAFMFLGQLGKCASRNENGPKRIIAKLVCRGAEESQKSIVLTHWLVKAFETEIMCLLLRSILNSGSDSRTAAECVHDENSKSRQAYHQVAIRKCSPTLTGFPLVESIFSRPRLITMQAHPCIALMPRTASPASLCRWTVSLA